MSLTRVKAALDSLGLRDQYLQNFVDNDFDDEMVDECFSDPKFAGNLQDVIRSAGHRIKFQKAFTALSMGTTSTKNIPLTQSVPLKTKTSEGQSSFITQTNLQSTLGISSKSQFTTSTPASKFLSTVKTDPRKAFETELIDLSEPQPIQIMDFKESGKQGVPSEIVFHENKFQEILSKTTCKKVAVLAIAGPCRKGKSFFLNFVLRYLNSLKTNNKDWMGWRKPNQGLKGFTWRNSTERVTTGIWMWSEPFTMKSKNEDVDLLLMDTQGVFDEHTTQREWSILVGLGLLTSSCLIFNIMSDLQEDYLQVFENFLSFGLMALNEKDSRTPFQRLVFLIRDWNIPGQHPYGSSGGKKFIDAKLDTKSHHKASHTRIRQQLKECFEDIHCFLLPHPGEKVLAMDFDGSAGKSETFAAEIEKCILELMNPLKFPAKKINGNFLTGQDLLATFQLYCELFNSDEVPNPESVFEIASKSCNGVVIKKCIDTLSTELLALSEERPFFLESDLEKLRIPAEQSCVEAFNKSRKMGDENMIREAEQLLRVQMESAFEHVKQKNALRLEQVVTHAKEDSIEKFDKLMNEHVQNRFLSAEKFLSVSRKAEEESLRIFTTACGTILPEAVESLRRLLQSRKEEFQNKNSLMKREAEKVLEKDIQILVQNYAENVSSQVTDRIIPLEELEKIHESSKKKVTIEFEELEPEEELLQDGLVTLESGIVIEFRRIKNEVENFIEKIQLKGKSLVIEAVAKFKAGLKNKITLDKKQFHENQEESLKSSKTFLKSAMPIDDNELLQKLFSELDDLIPDAYNELLQIVQIKEEELKTSLRQAKDDAAKDYSLAMEQLFPQNDQSPVDPALLESSHTKEKSTALQALKESFQNVSKACQGADENLLLNFNSELEEDVDKAYKSILEKNQLRKDNNDSKAQVYLAEVKDNYVNEMRQAIAQITEEAELRSRQSDVKKSSIAKLKEKIEPMMSPSQVIQKLVEDLNSYIDEEFEGTLELFRMKKEEDEYAVKSALLDARMYYNEEMEKHFQAKDWLEQAELEKLHGEIGEAAIERSKKEVALTSSQEKQLREAMLNLKRSYEEKNIMRMPRDSYAIGIDLGTTYSCVAVCIKGKIKVIPCDEKTTIPSYVAFSDDHSISVGDPAKDQAFRRPESTIFDAKRLIGRKFSDNIVKQDMELWPFEVIGENDQPMIKIPGHPNTYRPEQISAHVLAHLKKISEEYLNKRVTDAVVTVPAYFSDSQRQATKDAAQIAGLNAKILNEPTSAAIAYELHRTDDLKRNVLIFDLGGGTFDVAVLQMVGGNIDVKAIGGDTHLGGEDFDNEMVKHIIEVVKRKTGNDLGQGKDSRNPEEKRKAAERLRRIRSACEKQKRLLSSTSSTMISIDRIDDSYDLNEPFTRKDFEDLNMSKFKKCIEITDAAISDAKMSKDNIEDIVLIGGSTRIPKIRELLREYFNGKALNATINADEAVAFGAAVQAALEYGKKDEVSKNVSVSDVAPLSLGVENVDGNLSVIIPKNTPVPCSKSQKRYTVYDSQTSTTFKIFEGEELIAKNNNKLGQFTLSDIPSAPSGKEPLNVTMEIDSEGILHVTAVCMSTRGTKAIKIEAHKGRMSQQDISSAKANAEDFNW
ncbi:unnamed protein product [Allacma fusca]|uniref:GB1/RHD3-type G domain-containing protein n=1 Tax=Allacma fusca TaxID=39272 RepID=A0A8J2JA98_9HEXA|nr:unnamed protein product [Allacma fusca]